MNRRGFLGTLLALCAAPFVAPKPALAWKTLFKPAVLNDNYVCVLHPDSRAGFVSVTRRGQWADAYRAWRKDGRPGSSRPQDIWAAYGKTFDTDAFGGEIGSVEDVRFIESRELANFLTV